MANFQKACFNSNQDIRQSVHGDSGDAGDAGNGDKSQNNTSHRFSKTGGR